MDKCASSNTDFSSMYSKLLVIQYPSSQNSHPNGKSFKKIYHSYKVVQNEFVIVDAKGFLQLCITLRFTW
jgi:hypothetical protein